MENVWDTMISEQVRYAGLTKPKGYYTLEQTYERYFGVNWYGDQLSLFKPYAPKKIRNEISKKGEEPFTHAEISYGATDVECAYSIYKMQLEVLGKEDLLETAKLESSYVPVVGDMEFNGFPIKEPRWLELAKWSREHLEPVLEQLQKEHPNVANWNSSQQVKKYFKELGIPIPKVKGKESIEANHIKGLAEKFPVIEMYLRYKAFQKASSTYGEKFLRHINPYTGRVHTSFLQLKSTGRMSSTNPNCQNIITEKEGFKEGKW